MTTTTPLGAVLLLEGVHQEPSVYIDSRWIPAMSPKPYKPRVFDEAFAAWLLFLALRRVFIILFGFCWVESELLYCRGATKLGNNDTLHLPYRIVDASFVQEVILW
uniref:Uncharacterized protein n=1 Tax=Oryza glumipatula TaxID=40148 RepID=A0A0D9Y634_9ORYZ